MDDKFMQPGWLKSAMLQEMTGEQHHPQQQQQQHKKGGIQRRDSDTDSIEKLFDEISAFESLLPTEQRRNASRNHSQTGHRHRSHTRTNNGHESGGESSSRHRQQQQQQQQQQQREQENEQSQTTETRTRSDSKDVTMLNSGMMTKAANHSSTSCSVS